MAKLVVSRKLILCILTVFANICVGQLDENLCDGLIDGCYCTGVYIDCRGVEFSTITDIYPFITNITYRIRITDGNIRSIPDNLFALNFINGPLTQVKYLNLSGNNIVSLSESSFSQLPNLTVLDLSHNELTIDPCDSTNELTTSLSTLVELEELYLGHVLSSEVVTFCEAGNIFPETKMDKLKTLDLSYNNFATTGKRFDRFLCEPIFLTTLNLSGNNFQQFPVPQCMLNLQSLDLSYNQIPNMSPDEQDVTDSLVNLQSLRLAGNPFECDCMFESMLIWIKTTETPLDSDQMRCSSRRVDVGLEGPIRNLNFTQMCEEPRICILPPSFGSVTVARSTFIAIVAVGVLLLVTVVTVTVVCRRRRRTSGRSADTSPSKVPSYTRMV